jgi:hypothetical protein
MFEVEGSHAGGSRHIIPRWWVQWLLVPGALITTRGPLNVILTAVILRNIYNWVANAFFVMCGLVIAIFKDFLLILLSWFSTIAIFWVVILD